MASQPLPQFQQHASPVYQQPAPYPTQPGHQAQPTHQQAQPAQFQPAQFQPVQEPVQPQGPALVRPANVQRATSIWLALKLAVVLFMLCQGASIERIFIFHVVAFVFFLYQTGRLRFVLHRVRVEDINNRFRPMAQRGECDLVFYITGYLIILFSSTTSSNSSYSTRACHHVGCC